MTTRVDPATKDDLNLMWDVVARWAETFAETGGKGPKWQFIRGDFGSPLTPRTIRDSLTRRIGPIDSNEFGWLVLRPITRQDAVPVVCVAVGREEMDRIDSVAIRVALFSDRGDGTVASQGWRFEQAETNDVVNDDGTVTPPAHPYAHAQAINGWTIGGPPCLIHRPHGFDTECMGIDALASDDATGTVLNEERVRQNKAAMVKHPAFPLGVKTLTGLAFATIVTLYGVRGGLAVLDGYPRLRIVSGPLAEDLDTLGLREN